MINIQDIELSLSGMMKGITNSIPKIRINQEKVPPGTKKLQLVLGDIDFGNLPHGLHLFKFTGSDIILENKFKVMPLNPPENESHIYKLTVRALGGDLKVLGVGEVTQQFP